jgi:predicted acyl esterase
LQITGTITAHLFVSSTANDTDLAVKLEDVFPTGESMLVQDGILRMRWRNGSMSTTPSLMVPNQIYEVDVEIGFMSYIFNPLHQ